ncbi:class I SAM-dependent methyltransferase [Aureimonas leprariae]|uniref:Methyltransferase domain-containing protein n=1 Tax=Plantimonas leprariae TaxID=2615207 RepID=A0A7V7PRK8_9HYPH|nr:methyltransferase domain-containing protein [Aureimonas leprariae]KAB0681423.1 methyltransferase domain-containing protein [Aureimonas leprariae]
MTFVSPTTGLPLRADTPHSLADGSGERWPVADGIPYLRVNREALVGAALERLDAGDREGGLAELLRDADDWWDEPPPPHEAMRALVREVGGLTLREAMAQLGFGRVGDYFAHRWSDPTYLAGLQLIETHWNAPRTAFELACGIGHYLRVLKRQGAAATGFDVVFSKLWIARHFVVGPQTRLVCCDAAAPWPIGDASFDLVLCQDAFYFLEPKRAILDRLRSRVSPGGALLVGHVHNREAAGFSAGAAVTADEMLALFPDAVAYDDAELTRAAAGGRALLSKPLTDLRDAEAFTVAESPGDAVPVRLVAPDDLGGFRRNPLYASDGDGWRIRWPSERYEREYAPLATYPLTDRSDRPTPGNVRSRAFVDLPERW